MVNLEALAKLAQETTPGPWKAHRQSDGSPWWIESEDEHSVADAERAQDAAYIAASSPDVVLALVRAALAARTFMEEEIGWFRDEPHLVYTQVGDRTVRALRAALADLDR